MSEVNFVGGPKIHMMPGHFIQASEGLNYLLLSNKGSFDGAGGKTGHKTSLHFTVPKSVFEGNQVISVDWKITSQFCHGLSHW